MDLLELKKKELADFTKPQLLEALKCSGFKTKIDEAWTKAQIISRLMQIPGFPHITNEKDIEMNADAVDAEGNAAPFKLGEIVWLPEPTESDLALEKQLEGKSQEEQDKILKENQPQTVFEMLKTVNHNNVEYLKGKTFDLSPELIVVMRKLGAIK